MIIWLSGAYGVGKSTLAEALVNEIENAIIFDAEEVGNAVRDNYPGVPYGWIFEDYTLWCDFNYMLLKDIHSKFHCNILVPMTLLRQNSYTKIIEKLNNDGIDTKLIVLEGSYETIHDRILARGEDEDCWCMQNIELSSSAAKAVTGGYHILTDDRSVEELSNTVLDYIKQNSR